MLNKFLSLFDYVYLCIYVDVGTYTCACMFIWLIVSLERFQKWSQVLCMAKMVESWFTVRLRWRNSRAAADLNDRFIVP